MSIPLRGYLKECPILTNSENNRTTVRQIPSARHLTTTTTRSISTQLTRFSSPSSSLLSSAQRTTLLTSATPSFQSSPISLFSSPSTRSFSATAFLGAKRDTYNHSRRVQKRRHGFLARLKSRGGRKVLMRRRAKGRTNLSW